MMAISLVPDPGDGLTAALAEVLTQAGLSPDSEPPAYRSSWRVLGIEEGVERPTPSVTGVTGYSAFSPRSTRGANRA